MKNIETIETKENIRLSIAPMLDWTTTDFRYFARLFNPNVIMYSEMITTGAILHGDKTRHLEFHAQECPIVLQLGGSNPKELAECSRIGQEWGYNEINLNVGCPSDRVQHNKIGACLMAEPDLVAECVAEMQQAVDIPVTVKHRIGIDQHDSYEFMLNFVDTVAQAGCTHFIVHARIALLQGLSPKENRDIPPLRYEDVYRLKQERPHLTIEINGGIKTVTETAQHLQHVDGVMIGREAYHNPYLLAELAQHFDGIALPNRFDIMEKMLDYMQQRVDNGVPLSIMTRHLLGLFQHLPHGRKWRQALSGGNAKQLDDVRTALAEMRQLLADYSL